MAISPAFRKEVIMAESEAELKAKAAAALVGKAKQQAYLDDGKKEVKPKK